MDNAVVRVLLGAADYSSYPVFYGALPVVWAPVVLSDTGSDTAVRLTGGMFAGYGGAMGLKALVRRERPIAVHPWIVARPQYPGARDLDPHSWPSGHATMAAVVAGTIALKHPQPEVVVPAAFWALAVGTSRVWLGVHYPSDVVRGWMLGLGTAILIDRLRNNGGSDSSGGGTVLRLSIPLG